MNRQFYDLGIRAPYFVSVRDVKAANGHRFDVHVERDQFIGLIGSKISKVCSWESFVALATDKTNNGDDNGISEKDSVKRWIDASHHVVLPGLVNAHTHLPMSLFRGLADDAPLQSWLHEMIFPLEAHLADEAFCKAGTSLSLLEGIRSGTTTYGDMYFHQKTISEVAVAAGVRAVLAETIVDFPTSDNPKADDSVYRIIRDIRAELSTQEKVEIACDPHSPYSCSDRTIRKIDAFSRDEQLKILIHVAETDSEVDRKSVV